MSGHGRPKALHREGSPGMSAVGYWEGSRVKIARQEKGKTSLSRGGGAEVLSLNFTCVLGV